MKKLYTLSLLLVGALSFGQMTDSFSGTGALTANGWTTHSGTTGPLTISAGSIPYAALSTAGNKIALVAGATEDVNKSVGTPITTTAYYSTVLNFPNTTGLTTAGDYSMSFATAAGTTGVTALFGRLFLKASATAGNFNIGLVNASGTGTAPTYVATEFPVGTPVFVVVKYDKATGGASLFINPAPNSTEPAASLVNATSTATAATQIASVVLRQAGTATLGTGNVEYDDLRAADNWAYVTAGTLSINQNSISGLSVYPNPANTNLFITSDSLDVKEVEIFNVLGKQVLATTATAAPINIAALSTGVYVVKITEAGKTATRKLVVE